MSDAKQEVKVVEKPVKVRKKHYWWKYLIFFLLGTITPAGVVVGASFVVTPSQLMSVVGINSSDYITDEYNGMSIMTLISSIAKGDITFNNLEDVSKFTPLADKVLDMVNTSLESSLGCTIDMSTIKSASWSDIGTAVLNAAKSSITLADVLKVNDSSEKVLQYLCFADDGTKYNLDFLMKNMNSLISNITLDDVVNVGTSGILFELKDTKIGDMESKIKTIQLKDILTIDESSPKALQYLADMTISSDFNKKINDATLGDLIDVGTSGILYNLKDSNINSIATDVQTLPLNKLITINSSSPKALQYLADMTISGDFNTKIDNATIGDLVDVGTDTTSMLYSLKDKKLKDLNGTLTLGEVLGDQVNSNKILIALKDTQINSLATKIDTLALGDVMDITDDTTDPNYSPILSALKTKGATLTNIGSKINELTINDCIAEADRTAYIFNAIGTCTLGNLGSTVENLTLGDIIEVTGTSNSIVQQLKDVKITSTDLSNAINNLTLESILGLNSSSPKILLALKDKKLSDLNDTTINSITLESVFSDEQIAGSKILGALVTKGATSGTITTMMDDLTIGEMVDVPNEGETNYSPILYALKDKKINELSSAIASLTVADVFTSTELSSSSFLAALDPTTPISSIGTAVEALPIVKVFKDSVYESDGTTLKSMWKYLLDDPDDSTDTVETYTMNSASFNRMNSNFTKNINKATLGALVDDGFMTISETTLNKSVLIGGELKLVKNLTLQEFFDYTSALIV